MEPRDRQHRGGRAGPVAQRVVATWRRALRAGRQPLAILVELAHEQQMRAPRAYGLAVELLQAGVLQFRPGEHGLDVEATGPAGAAWLRARDSVELH